MTTKWYQKRVVVPDQKIITPETNLGTKGKVRIDSTQDLQKITRGTQKREGETEDPKAKNMTLGSPNRDTKLKNMKKGEDTGKTLETGRVTGDKGKKA